MKVRAVLDAKGSDVHTIRPQETIQTVIRRFKEKGIGALVVSENYVEVQGMISERDIILGLTDLGAKLFAMPVAAVMTKCAICSPDDELELVMARMTTRRIRHLAVSDDGVLCGIISIGDVIKKRLNDLQMETNVLRDAYFAGSVAG